MRDAFGGAFMIKLFLIFIIIYVGFTAIALNYAKAFKVKNKVIEYLETNEIADLLEMNASESIKMENFFDEEILGNMNYYVPHKECPDSEKLIENEEGQVIGYCHPSGVKITIGGKAENTAGVYYTVETQVGWSIPFINKILAINGSENGAEVSTGKWIISGQTRLIVKE